MPFRDRFCSSTLVMAKGSSSRKDVFDFVMSVMKSEALELVRGGRAVVDVVKFSDTDCAMTGSVVVRSSDGAVELDEMDRAGR
jgi:hypothetical protein